MAQHLGACVVLRDNPWLFSSDYSVQSTCHSTCRESTTFSFWFRQSNSWTHKHRLICVDILSIYIHRINTYLVWVNLERRKEKNLPKQLICLRRKFKHFQCSPFYSNAIIFLNVCVHDCEYAINLFMAIVVHNYLYQVLQRAHKGTNI